MSVADDLKNKTLELRKARDPLSGAFQAVQAMATASAKERGLKTGDFQVTDEDAVRAINKGIKQVQDLLALLPEGAPARATNEAEMAALRSILPSMVSEDDLRDEVQAFVRTIPEPSMKQMGLVMTHLTAKYGTAFDKATASRVARDELTR